MDVYVHDESGHKTSGEGVGLYSYDYFFIKNFVYAKLIIGDVSHAIYSG